ncbi:Uncharacterised protein [Mycobacteroides abscessus]|nr:Uncharacterised protein [Mycobacteroides abscessus]
MIHSPSATLPAPIHARCRRSWCLASRRSSGNEYDTRHHGSSSPCCR